MSGGWNSVDTLLRRFPQLQMMTPALTLPLGRLFVSLTPDYLLSRFGPRYLAEAFWQRFCDIGGCFGFVWFEQGERLAVSALHGEHG